MRIFLACRSSVFHMFGGMPEAAWDSCRALADAGHDVHFATSKILDKPASFDSDGVHVHQVADSMPIKYDEKFYNGIRRIFDKLNAEKAFDAVLSHSTACRDLLVKNRVKVPVVMVCHGSAHCLMQNDLNLHALSKSNNILPIVAKYHNVMYVHNHADWRMPEAAMYKLHDAVVSISDAMYTDIALRYGCRSFMICNPCYASHVERDQSDIRILTGGSNHTAIKGMDYAIAGLNSGKYKVTLVGRGTEKFKKAPWLSLPGAVPASEILEMLKSHHILVDSAVHYSGVNVFMTRALGYGMPVVGFAVGGASMALSRGGGVVLPLGCSSGILPAVDTIVSDYKGYALRARATWEELFNPVTYAGKVESMFKELGANVTASR